MKSKHDKLFVPSANYLKKFSTILKKRIAPIRLKVAREIEQQLKNEKVFKVMPFLWLNSMEHYGDFEAIVVKIGKIDKNYGDIGMDIYIPISDLKDLEQKTDLEVEEFFRNIFLISIRIVFTKFLVRKTKRHGLSKK